MHDIHDVLTLHVFRFDHLDGLVPVRVERFALSGQITGNDVRRFNVGYQHLL